MERGEIVDCIVTRQDVQGLWVRSGELVGVVDRNEIAWKSDDFPALGDRVKVLVKFLTFRDDVVLFDFVGSIKDAYPESHPINFVDDTIVGSRFSSRILGGVGPWYALRHPSGLFALLPRESLDPGSFSPDDEIEVVVSGIDRERKRLLVRLAKGSAAGASDESVCTP